MIPDTKRGEEKKKEPVLRVHVYLLVFFSLTETLFWCTFNQQSIPEVFFDICGMGLSQKKNILQTQVFYF